MRRNLPRCSPANWAALLEAAGEQGSTLDAPTAALDDVMGCHRGLGLKVHSGLICMTQGRNHVVGRERLHDFLAEHGERCGKKVKIVERAPRPAPGHLERRT